MVRAGTGSTMSTNSFSSISLPLLQNLGEELIGKIVDSVQIVSTAKFGNAY